MLLIRRNDFLNQAEGGEVLFISMSRMGSLAPGLCVRCPWQLNLDRMDPTHCGITIWFALRYSNLRTKATTFIGTISTLVDLVISLQSLLHKLRVHPASL